jgi:hypothetical protein
LVVTAALPAGGVDDVVVVKRHVVAPMLQKQLVRSLKDVIAGHQTVVPLAPAGQVTMGGWKMVVPRLYNALPVEAS